MSRKATINLPPITSSGTSELRFAEDTEENNNPFKLPGDDKIFRMREDGRRKKNEAREMSATMKVWQKSKSGLLSRSERLQELIGDSKPEKLSDLMKTDPEITLKMSAPRRQEKENMTEFVAKKSESSLYALDAFIVVANL
jgi:hypothetical protein